MLDIVYGEGYTPGLIGRVVELHARYYARQWHFGPYFESKVAAEMAEYIGRYNVSRDRIFWAVLDGTIHGSLTVDGNHTEDRDNAGAHLRWFILSDEMRGRGVGNALIERAVGFCRHQGYGRAYLWTFAGLESARHLYEKSGFTLSETNRGAQWGVEVEEQRFELVMS